MRPGAGETLTASGAPLERYRWVVVAGLVASNWGLSLPFISLGLLLPAITDSFDLSDTEAGWLGAVLTIGNTVAAIPAAAMLSRSNPRRLAILATGLGAMFTFFHGLAPVFLVLVLVRLGFGFVYAMRNTARALLVQLWFPVSEVPLVNGIAIGLIGVSEFAVLVLTPVILDATNSWRTTYYLFGAFAALMFVLWLVFGRDPKHGGGADPALGDGREPVMSLLRHKQIWAAGLGVMGVMFSWTALATFWPTYMLEENDFPLTRSGLVFGIGSAATIPASLLLGYYARRLRNRAFLLTVSGVAITASSAAVLLTDDLWALALLFVVNGFGWGFLPITQSLPYEIPGITARSVALNSSLMWTFLFAGGILGPIVVGAVSDITGSLFGALMVAAFASLALTVVSRAVEPGAQTPKPS